MFLSSEGFLYLNSYSLLVLDLSHLSGMIVCHLSKEVDVGVFVVRNILFKIIFNLVVGHPVPQVVLRIVGAEFGVRAVKTPG